MVILLIIEYIPKCKNYRLKQIQKFCRFRTKGIHPTMFWSSPISILQETFMIVLFSLLLHLLMPHFAAERTFGERLNNWAAYIFVPLIIAAPIACFVLLISKFDRLGSRSFTLRFGTLYADLDLKKKWAVVIFKLSFYLRRILLIAAILLVKHRCF